VEGRTDIEWLLREKQARTVAQPLRKNDEVYRRKHEDSAARPGDEQRLLDDLPERFPSSWKENRARRRRLHFLQE
jgi:hypothetical protein